MTASRAAEWLRLHGFALCKPDPKEKKPTYPKWPTFSKEPTDFADGDMIGILGGPLSAGGKPGHALVIVDLDAEAAIDQADEFLPPSAMAEGRESKPRSHRYYLVPAASIPPWAESKAPQAADAAKKATGHPGPFLKHFADRETGRGVIDFIGTGGQCVCPPSLHASGEPREWDGGRPGEPGVVEFIRLWRAVCELASACGCEIPDVVPRPPAGRPVHPAPPIIDRAAKYLAACEPSVSGSGGHRRAFFAARAVVYGFDLGPDVGYELLRDHWNARCLPPWSEKDLRHKCESADRVPFDRPRGWLRDAERNGHVEGGRRTGGPSVNGSRQATESPTDQPPWAAKPKATAPRPGVTAAALIAREFQPPRFAIDNLLPEGLTLLGGRPKQGKSWLALLLAWAVAAGNELDGRGGMPGAVLYLALEDTDRRLQGRLTMLQGSLGWEAPARLTLNTSWPRSPDGLYYVAEWLDSRKDEPFKFVIVDTLVRFRTPQNGRGNSYAEDSEALGSLKQLLDHYRASGLVVHHTRKLRAEDPFDELSGTLGLTGAADTIWVLDRVRGSDAAKLYVTGRDLADATIDLAWQKEHCRWLVGANRDGIDTAGREINPAVGKLESCKAWLLEFLKVFAHPSDEIQEAGVKKGFAPTTVRQAKVELGGKGTGQVVHRQIDGGWWSGIGPQVFWKLRPPSAREARETIPD